MKVILLTDIPKVGKKHDIKEFKEGYAQNVLLAKGLAELATPQALGRLEDMKAKQKRMTDNENTLFQESLNTLKTHDLIITARANEKGHLFKTITVSDVVSLIKNLSGLVFDESIISIPHIKALGDYEIHIKKGTIEGKYMLHVLAQ